jgi:Domain of Unknown Function (DUF1080)
MSFTCHRPIAVSQGFLRILSTIAFCAVAAVSWAESPAAAGEQSPVQLPAAINFRPPTPLDFVDHAGYVSIFDGLSLKDWDGDPSVWRVENGAIVGVSTKEHPTSNTYIVYRGFEAKDFDLKLEIKVEGNGGSGIQYRSKTGIQWRVQEPNLPDNLNWLLTGPQADIWAPVSVLASIYTGQFYSENTPQGIVAWRGQVVDSSPGQWPRLVGNIGDRLALGGYVRNNAWNEYLIMARGSTFIHVMNGQLMAVYVDDDPTSSNNQSGFVGIELEGAPAKVSVRNVWIKRLPLTAASASAPVSTPAKSDSVAGRWKVDLQLNGMESGDPQACTFTLKDKHLSGSCSSDQGSRELRGEVDGKSVSWRMNSGLFGEAAFTGTFDSDFMTGTFKLKRAAILGDFTFRARRVE